MGGEFTYPKMVPLVLTHGHIEPYLALRSDNLTPPSQALCRHGAEPTADTIPLRHQAHQCVNLPFVGGCAGRASMT